MSLRAASRAGAAHVCAQARRAYVRKRSARGTARRHAMSHVRGARRRHGILEQGSRSLSEIGRRATRGSRTGRNSGRPGEARGARGCGMRGADFELGRGRRGARGACQRPQEPAQVSPNLASKITIYNSKRRFSVQTDQDTWRVRYGHELESNKSATVGTQPELQLLQRARMPSRCRPSAGIFNR